MAKRGLASIKCRGLVMCMGAIPLSDHIIEVGRSRRTPLWFPSCCSRRRWRCYTMWTLRLFVLSLALMGLSEAQQRTFGCGQTYGSVEGLPDWNASISSHPNNISWERLPKPPEFDASVPSFRFVKVGLASGVGSVTFHTVVVPAERNDCGWADTPDEVEVYAVVDSKGRRTWWRLKALNENGVESPFEVGSQMFAGKEEEIGVYSATPDDQVALFVLTTRMVNMGANSGNDTHERYLLDFRGT